MKKIVQQKKYMRQLIALISLLCCILLCNHPSFSADSKSVQALANQSKYTGQKITLNFQDIQLRAVLQLLAEFTSMNIVASDSVHGNITLRLHQVPWDQALDIILTTQGLAKKQYGNVMLIAPMDELAAREKQELQIYQDVANSSPVISELIPINYAAAQDIADLIKDEKNSLLSGRGHVTTDVRTNTLWVQDTAHKIAEIRRILEKLDQPVRQVMIEARIVTVNRDYEENLGLRFGLTKVPQLSTTSENTNQMLGGTPVNETPIGQRFNMDFRAVPTTLAMPATIGLALANLGKGYLLDLELSALEKEGLGTIISSPRLVTADQQTARIESGEEIPYQESTSSGATNIQFKKASLSLQVTPHISPNNQLVMDLEVHQDSRGASTPTGVPAINTRQIQTRVVVNNGETIVLGGIYEQIKTDTIKRIPFLGSLPGIGGLFRNTQNINNRTELIIFITPKIVDNSGVFI